MRRTDRRERVWKYYFFVSFIVLGHQNCGRPTESDEMGKGKKTDPRVDMPCSCFLTVSLRIMQDIAVRHPGACPHCDHRHNGKVRQGRSRKKSWPTRE
jgi:hypothetical protein